LAAGFATGFAVDVAAGFATAAFATGFAAAFFATGFAAAAFATGFAAGFAIATAATVVAAQGISEYHVHSPSSHSLVVFAQLVAVAT